MTTYEKNRQARHALGVLGSVAAWAERKHPPTKIDGVLSHTRGVWLTSDGGVTSTLRIGRQGVPYTARATPQHLKRNHAGVLRPGGPTNYQVSGVSENYTAADVLKLAQRARLTKTAEADGGYRVTWDDLQQASREAIGCHLFSR
jgi:hypothetical protein